MTTKVTQIPLLNPIAFINHQIEHYTQRIMDARNFEERHFCRKELYNLKQAFITYYN